MKRALKVFAFQIGRAGVDCGACGVAHPVDEAAPSAIYPVVQVFHRYVLKALCAGSLVLPGTALCAQATGDTVSGLMVSQMQRHAGMPSPNPLAVSQSTGGASGASWVPPAQKPLQPLPEPTVARLTNNLQQYVGKKIILIQYTGVEFAKSDRLAAELSLRQGDTFIAENVRQTERRLFATGRYRNIDVRVLSSGNDVTVIFGGVPRYYVGRVQIDGIREDRLTSLVEYGTNLNPGTPFKQEALAAATASVKQILAQNGYFEPRIAIRTERDDDNQQINVTYTVVVGPSARVGDVTITGKDPGITEADFRKKGKLKRRVKVERETVSNALSKLRDYFQKKDHLEATVSLQRSTYTIATKTINYDFLVEQGPNVQVKVEGAKFSKSRLHLLVPVYEEGTVDSDLLNEGSFNMRDFLQQQGFFDAKVGVQQVHPGTGGETVLYTVDRGMKHKVQSVEITGNKYFASDLLKDSLRIQKADAYQRAGRYSAQLAQSDEKNIAALYRANGFSKVKVSSSVQDVDTSAQGKDLKVRVIKVAFKIDEGMQQTFGEVKLNGIPPERVETVAKMLQATPGQPFSLLTLSGDRDTVLSYLLSNGFDQARIEVKQTVDVNDQLKTDIAFNVMEGEQVFTGKVLESGIHFTRPKTVTTQVKMHEGDPLDQSALVETQRNLYNLALFNEVNAVVQNPEGDAEQKNVLVQITEAKRWDVTYGFGLEVQTGVPNCGMYCTKEGSTAAQQGKAGGSPRISLDVSRINLRGTDNSLTFHGDYGLLEEVVSVTFQNPHLFGNRKLAGQIAGGYSNVQNISTFASSTLQGSFHVTQKATRKDTFIYTFQYRRVAVDPNSLAISADLIPILSQPVRVGGPGITWFHDTRSPSPLDANKGSYTSIQEFLATSKFGSQTSFNRTDVSNATYYRLGKKSYVFARNTRVGAIYTAGKNQNAGTVGSPAPAACVGELLNSNASCNAVPLPERLYAGGATSHRGFPINGAGPRDLQTGFPVGGSAVFVNTFELRLPAQTLPIVGNSVSFVLFHDMGNVFYHPSDLFPSFIRFRQPDVQSCSTTTGTIGTCKFNYFSHAIGVGARYHTAVGPVRLDLSYNLNPPKYPIFPTGASTATPTLGQASHFNFFFSIGQSF